MALWGFCAEWAGLQSWHSADAGRAWWREVRGPLLSAGVPAGHRRAVPTGECYSESARRYVNPPRRWRAGMLSASSRSAGTGVEHCATCVLVPASSPSEPPHPGGGRGGAGAAAALPSRPPPSSFPPPPRSPPPSRAAPHGLRAAEEPPSACSTLPPRGARLPARRGLPPSPPPRGASSRP